MNLHADDIMFYVKAPNINDAVAFMNEAVSQFSEWCCHNKLTINNKKCKSMLFSNKIKKKNDMDLQHIKVSNGPELFELVSD